MTRLPFCTIPPAALLVSAPLFAQDTSRLPIADAHVHYSHDSVEMTPPERVIELMREANLKLALVSSSDDQGTQLLTALAPDLIVPGLRPYSRRGQTGSWFTSDENLAYVERLIATNRYASIGEFHLYGADADLPIPRRIVELAEEHNLILHAHSDADAVERLLAQSPEVKVIWAHAGFDNPAEIAPMLEKHDRLWADLAFRSGVGPGGELGDDWKQLFIDYPDRLMLGTDTYTPERMYFIPSHAETARAWMTSLPEDVAEQLAWKNAYDLITPVWEANRDTTLASEDPMAALCNALDASTTTEEDGTTVSITPMNELKVSEPVSVTVTVCGDNAADAVVTLDASMPAHGHGMNYAPEHTVTLTGDAGQQVQVDGLLLHMPGNWEWRVDIDNGTAKISLREDFAIQ